MAKKILTNASIVIDGVDLSNHGNRVEINSEKELQETTAFGSSSKEYLIGLGDGTMSFAFQQDLAVGSVDTVLWGCHSAGTAVVIVVKADSAAPSTTNPKWTMTGVLPNYQPLSGDVGAVSMVEAQFQNASPTGIVRATS